MADATNPDAVKNAIRLGAHSVEHGCIMDDECIAVLLEDITNVRHLRMVLKEGRIVSDKRHPDGAVP
jgi:imidazolonepropionase-like amidohydrolase